MNTIEYLRNNLVDYKNQTPNEARYKKDGLLESTIFYPLGNMYYNKYRNNQHLKIPSLCCRETDVVEEQWFLDRLHDQQIEYAIKYLQVETLQKYIIPNYKSVLFKNPFYQLFYTYYPIDTNLQATQEIIKILIDNYEDYYDLITTIKSPSKETEYILEILYTFLPNDENNLCSICLETEPKKLLINCCDCKTSSHATCLLKLHKYKPLEKCSVCTKKYQINQPVINTNSGINIIPVNVNIFFPHNDIYYLGYEQFDKFIGMERLTMAIAFLQTERVRELLQEKDILDNFPNYYFGYEGYKQTPIHALCNGNLFTNVHYKFGENRYKYNNILKLLLQTNKFDIEQKDAFDKTPMDYVEEYGLNILQVSLVNYQCNSK